MRVWIDIDNPPQVQYLTPFVDAFQRRGDEVVVTARDNGITYDLLRQSGAAFTPIGRTFGRSRTRKVVRGVIRATALMRHIHRQGGAALLLASSRPSALAACALGIPAFVICDYEHVELTSYRRSGTSLLFPDVIDGHVFREMGFPSNRLLPFHGLKEDITFARRSLDAPVPTELKERNGLVRVLVRPPAEDSHYFNSRSRSLTDDVLDFLARATSVRVVLSPRHPVQAERLRRHRWVNDPVILSRAVPVVSLLRAVDWVICSGGTMLREAAYLGIPAIGIFGGPTGSVDAYLASLGAIRLVSDASELLDIDWRAERGEQIVPHHTELVEQIVERLVTRVLASGYDHSVEGRQHA
jgi:predicted glycosyltransferase